MEHRVSYDVNAAYGGSDVTLKVDVEGGVGEIDLRVV
jgi:hypothetical protein